MVAMVFQNGVHNKALSDEINARRNMPDDPFTLFAESIDDLLLEAQNFLDGSEIENEEQERAVASILTRLRREANGADEARKAEKLPHDEAAKAVQSKWAPLLSKADLAVRTAKTVLGAYLQKKETAQRAAAEAARQEADRQATAAREAAEKASPSDLAGQTTARVLQENAAAAAKTAGRLEKAKPQAAGGERAVGLRTSYVAEITDPIAFGKWAWEHRKEEYLAFLTSLALRECRHGPRDLPGVGIIETKQAV